MSEAKRPTLRSLSIPAAWSSRSVDRSQWLQWFKHKT